MYRWMIQSENDLQRRNLYPGSDRKGLPDKENEQRHIYRCVAMMKKGIQGSEGFFP